MSRYPEGSIAERFLVGHTKFISSVLLLGEERPTVVSGGGDRELYVWDVKDGSCSLKKPIADAVVPFITVRGLRRRVAAGPAAEGGALAEEAGEETVDLDADSRVASGSAPTTVDGARDEDLGLAVMGLTAIGSRVAFFSLGCVSSFSCLRAEPSLTCRRSALRCLQRNGHLHDRASARGIRPGRRRRHWLPRPGVRASAGVGGRGRRDASARLVRRDVHARVDALSLDVCRRRPRARPRPARGRLASVARPLACALDLTPLLAPPPRPLPFPRAAPVALPLAQSPRSHLGPVAAARQRLGALPGADGPAKAADRDGAGRGRRRPGRVRARGEQEGG